MGRAPSARPTRWARPVPLFDLVRSVGPAPAVKPAPEVNPTPPNDPTPPNNPTLPERLNSAEQSKSPEQSNSVGRPGAGSENAALPSPSTILRTPSPPINPSHGSGPVTALEYPGDGASLQSRPTRQRGRVLLCGSNPRARYPGAVAGRRRWASRHAAPPLSGREPAAPAARGRRIAWSTPQSRPGRADRIRIGSASGGNRRTPVHLAARDA